MRRDPHHGIRDALTSTPGRRPFFCFSGSYKWKRTESCQKNRRVDVKRGVGWPAGHKLRLFVPLQQGIEFLFLLFLLCFSSIIKKKKKKNSLLNGPPAPGRRVDIPKSSPEGERCRKHKRVASIKTTYDISLDFGIYCYQEDSVRMDPTGLGRLQGAYVPFLSKPGGSNGIPPSGCPGNNI